MADTKLTGLTAYTGQVAADELLYVVDDPSGTPVSKKATRAQVTPWDLIADVSDTTAASVSSGAFDATPYAELIVRLDGTVGAFANTPASVNGHVGDGSNTVDGTIASGAVLSSGYISVVIRMAGGAAKFNSSFVGFTDDGTLGDNFGGSAGFSATTTISFDVTDINTDPLDWATVRLVVWGLRYS